MESYYDDGGTSVSDISNKSHDIISDSDLPATKQVNNFISDGFYQAWHMQIATLTAQFYLAFAGTV